LAGQSNIAGWAYIQTNDTLSYDRILSINRESEVHTSIGCGYCDHKCPSRDLTKTPRSRIIMRRALNTLELNGDIADYKLLKNRFNVMA